MALKLLTYKDKRPSLTRLATELFLSSSQVYQALRRLESSQLIHSSGFNHVPNLQALHEFLIHGVKYAFPPDRGEITRGLRTAHAAPPLRDLLLQSEEPPLVWPWAEGADRGMSFQPFYPNMPAAALMDNQFYEMLALVDAIRDGRKRERKLAESELMRRIDALGA